MMQIVVSVCAYIYYIKKKNYNIYIHELETNNGAHGRSLRRARRTARLAHGLP